MRYFLKGFQRTKIIGMHFRVESVEGLLFFLSAGTQLALEKTLPTPMDGRTIELALYVLRSKWKWPQESRIHFFSSSSAPIFSVNLWIVGSSCTELCSVSWLHIPCCLFVFSSIFWSARLFQKLVLKLARSAKSVIHPTVLLGVPLPLWEASNIAGSP